jgi:hypothetical protein
LLIGGEQLVDEMGTTLPERLTAENQKRRR